MRENVEPYRTVDCRVARIAVLLMVMATGLAVAGPPESESIIDEDWPAWRGPNGDGIARSGPLLEEWPDDGPPLLWSVPVGEGYSGIVVVGKRLLTLDRRDGQEFVRCFSLEDGASLWESGEPIDYENEEGSGPRACCSVAGDRVIALGATGSLRCLQLADGALVWRVDLPARFEAQNLPWGTSASPLVRDGRVYVMPGGRQGGSVAALDLRTGDTIWQALDDKAGYASPLAITFQGRPLIVFFTGYAVVGLDPATAELAFRHPWETQFDHNIATPIYDEPYLFITSGYGGGCSLLELASEREGGAITCGTVYKNKQMASHFSTPVKIGPAVYGFHEGFLVCLDWKTGKRRWIQRGFGKGSLTAAGDRLYVLSDDGRLVLAAVDPEKFVPLAEFQPLAGRCWTVPVIARRRLLVRDLTQLRCYDLRGR